MKVKTNICSLICGLEITISTVDIRIQPKKKMAPLFGYVSTQLFTEKGVQISCLGKTKKAGYFFVPLISPKLFQS